jgi:hypothetical protein
LLGRSESSGGGDKGGDDSRLHFDYTSRYTEIVSRGL